MMIIYILYFGYKVQECKKSGYKGIGKYSFFSAVKCASLVILTVILFYSLSFFVLKVYTLFCSVAK